MYVSVIHNLSKLSRGQAPRSIAYISLKIALNFLKKSFLAYKLLIILY